MHSARLAERNEIARLRIIKAVNRLAKLTDVEPPAPVNGKRGAVRNMLELEAVADWLETLASELALPAPVQKMPNPAKKPAPRKRQPRKKAT